MSGRDRRRADARIARWRACGRSFDGDHLNAFAQRVARDEARRVLESLRDEIDIIKQECEDARLYCQTQDEWEYAPNPAVELIRDRVRELLGEPIPVPIPDAGKGTP